MAKTAKQRLSEKKASKIVTLEKDFAGVKKGQTLFVATPQIVDEYIARIPYGETRTIERMRADMATRRKCDASCPVSTAIFIRISAEAAIEDMAAGVPYADVTPFWRLLTSKDKIAKKLSIDPNWLDTQREMEQQTSAAGAPA